MNRLVGQEVEISIGGPWDFESEAQTYSYSRRHIAGAGLTGSIDGQWCLRPISTLFV